MISTSYLIQAGNSSVNQRVEVMAFDSISRETTWLWQEEMTSISTKKIWETKLFIKKHESPEGQNISHFPSYYIFSTSDRFFSWYWYNYDII